MSPGAALFVFVFLFSGGGWGREDQSLFHLYFVPSLYVVLSLSLDTNYKTLPTTESNFLNKF